MTRTKEMMRGREAADIVKRTATVGRKHRKSTVVEPTPIPGFADYGATPDGRIFSQKLGGKWRKLALHTKGKGGDYLKVKLYTS